MKRSSNHVKGFTLIELITVIILLGILSAFAIPRIADFSSQAKSSSIEAAKNSVRSAAAITHATCLAMPDCDPESANEAVILEGISIKMLYGYPNTDSIVMAANIDGYNLNSSTAPMIISIDGVAGDPCFSYTSATDKSTPAVVSATGTYSDKSTDTDSTDDTCF